MEITKTFTNTLPITLHVKIRNFLRRSVYGYIIGAGLLTYGLNTFQLRTPTNTEILKTWALWAIVICSLALIVILISAIVQSRRQVPKQISFSETTITITQADDVETKTWDWVIVAEELEKYLALLVQKVPRYELFLSKKFLSEEEHQQLRTWLVEHDNMRK